MFNGLETKIMFMLPIAVGSDVLSVWLATALISARVMAFVAPSILVWPLHQTFIFCVKRGSVGPHPFSDIHCLRKIESWSKGGIK